MLTETEMKDVIDVLGATLLTINVNDRATWLRGQIPSGDFQRELNRLLQPASNHSEWAVFAIQVCMERGWQDGPPSWMESLITGIDNEPLAPRKISKCATILDRIRAGTDPRHEAVETELVLNDVPFLDREDLRNQIRELLEMGQRKVLVIAGDIGSGRSYCSELLHYISNQYGYFFKVAGVALKEGQGRVYTPKLLAINIAGAMSSSASPPEIDPTHRDIEPYKNFILTIAENSANRWWILLDGFDDVPIENETRALIQALATSIASERYGERLRLILIDYKNLRLNVMRMIPGKVTSQSISKQHVRSYFGKLRIKCGSARTDQELDNLTEVAWSNLPEDQTRLQVLNDRVSELALLVATS